jgi:hypothetical protein
MNRSLTALFSALEALLVVGIGIGIPLVPLTALWAFQYGLQIDWVIFWRTAVDIWLLGSGVDVTVTLNPAIATGLGFADAGKPFVLTVALLGFSLLTILLGARAGRRIGDIPFRFTGIVVSMGAFAVLSLAVTVSALWASARASIWQGTLLPTIVYGIGIAIGLWQVRRARRAAAADVSPVEGRLSMLASRPGFAAMALASVRGGAAATAIVIGMSALIVAVVFLGSYARVIALYESIHAGVLGGIAITVGQLSLLPNVIVWCASWLIGPGFAVGSGSTLSPLGTTLGPIPAIPMLGALPNAQNDWGFVGLVIPVVSGFVVAIAVRPRLVASIEVRGRLPWLLITGASIGIVAGILFGLLAWASAGAAGPGRLIDVGPAPLLVAVWSALEVGLAAIVGMLVGAPARQSQR